MDINKLISFLLTSPINPSATDSYWNDVRLLLRLDKDANALGLPLYRDYSRYQLPVREWIGESDESRISFLNNPNDTLPTLTNTSDITLNSYCYIPNKFNHAIRLSELNSNTTLSNIPVSYLEVPLTELGDLDFLTNDFTIEFSFFADEVNLPWRWQTLWTVGSVLRMSDINPPLNELKTYISRPGNIPGWGCFLRDNDLVFAGQTWEIKLNTNPIEKLRWYHVCLQRTEGVLKAFIDSNQTLSQTFTANLRSTNLTTFEQRILIGASQPQVVSPPNNTVLERRNQIDTSFSGGFTNFRITANSRYAGSFYTIKLPHIVVPSDNKLDPLYNDVLFNLPFSYDFYNYAPNHAHFKNRVFLKGVPNFQTGFLPITGFNSYQTNSVNTTLSNNEWTIEFFICRTLNGNVYFQYPYPPFFPPIAEEIFHEWLSVYRVRQISNTNFLTSINLLSLRSEDKKVLDINFNFVITDLRPGGYFSVKASSDGENWIAFPYDEDINWHKDLPIFSGTSNPPFFLPNSEIKFHAMYGGPSFTELPSLSDTQSTIPSGYSSKPRHIAISRYNNLLYFLIDGVVVKSVPFNYTLYQFNNNLTLTICGQSFPEIIGFRTGDTTSSTLGLALKGVRVTNKARYSFVNTNNVHDLNSVQPLPLTSGAIAPSRARVLDLKKVNTNASVSTQQVSWKVFLSQPVDNLVLADFTLSGVGGITGYSLVSLTKESEYVYTLVADTGTGNGELTANFIDRKTVKYKNKNTFISHFVTELDVQGETYVVNKNAPVPFLTSGSNPYVSNAFIVKLTFDAAIDMFNPANIGVVNGFITNIQRQDELSHIYNITIAPIKEGVVIVQCMEGVGLTDSNIPSAISAPFVRIYSEVFPILQTPLNITNTVYDLSPSAVILEEVIPNNTEYSNTIYPIGDNSSLYVRPLLEQSGLRFNNFNAVGSTIDTTAEEWTIEFFLRINSTVTGTSRRAHILSVENPSTGFSIVCDNGQLRVQRTINSTGNLLGSLTMADRDTTNFIEWSNSSFSQLEKYPHFAITYRQGVYRFYRNGKRVGLLQSSALIDITKGDIYIGYYPNRVNDVEFYLSNVRLTLGKALYTSFEVNVPGLPYNVLPNITDSAQLLNYISIYSNNEISTTANTGDTITLKFSSIISLTNIPIVQILNRPASVIKDDQGIYYATTQVLSTDVDGQVPFSITISGQVGIPTKVFTSTTNTSAVFIDNTPLQASITSDTPDDGRYIIPATLSLTEPIRGFSANVLVCNNCIIGNVRKLSNENRYSFTITALTSGDISVQLPANVVQDLAGNYNLASNIFSRNVVVPSYIPDPNFNNVLLLIQPENNIIDESSFNRPITVHNVSIVNEEVPQGLNKALYFNGKDSSLEVNLANTLATTEAYTIEFFVYFKSKVVFRLGKPKALPASDVQSSSFIANWLPVENASSYLLDVSKQANFTTFVPGYKNINVGNVASLQVSTTKLDSTPRLKHTRIRGKTGFVTQWSYIGEHIGFKYDVALDSNFVNKLYYHSNKLVRTQYATIGNIENALQFSPDTNLTNINEETLPYALESGVVLTGLLSNTNYPKLYYFLEEGTVRLYPEDGYVKPALAEDIDPLQWYHIAIVNDVKYTYLYVNGERVDKVRNTNFSTQFDIGYDIGHFYGYMTGIRITKGIKRYTNNFTVPSLPFSKN